MKIFKFLNLTLNYEILKVGRTLETIDFIPQFCSLELWISGGAWPWQEAHLQLLEAHNLFFEILRGKMYFEVQNSGHVRKVIVYIQPKTSTPTGVQDSTHNQTQKYLCKQHEFHSITGCIVPTSHSYVDVLTHSALECDSLERVFRELS